MHYCGYSSQYDEWRPKAEITYAKPTFRPSDNPYSPLTELACMIKKRLLPKRSDDPEVRIQVPCDLPTFQELQSLAIPSSKTNHAECKTQYTIEHYEDFDDVLGKMWHIRVVNETGDFSYVILETVSFHLSKGRPILEYVTKKADGTLKLSPTYIEQPSSLIFKFVRGDGNKKKLLNFI